MIDPITALAGIQSAISMVKKASKVANDYFNVVTWTGNGTSSGRSITGVGFQPDFVWGKARSVAYGHGLYDAVRGSGKLLVSNNTNSEATNFLYGYLSSFDSDGFTTTAGSSSNENWNQTNDTYVAWNWKANGAGSTNTAGTITSTVSANTTAATHVADSKVTISPTFPRFSVKRAINDTIRSLGASIFAVKSTSFTFNAAQSTYAFNNLDIKNILTVSWEDIGPSKEWRPLRRWDFDSTADATAWGAGAQTITLGEAPISGRTVRVVYAADPTAFTTNAQVYTTQTGLPESTRDVVILGAAYRLLTFLDPARASQVSPQADETDSKRPYGASQSATKQLYALYTQRLNEETQSQQQNYPPRVHFSRR